MRKGSTVQVKIDRTEFPSVGIGELEGKKIYVKGAFPGQTVSGKVKKKKEDLVFRYRQGMPIEFISYLKSDESYEKLGIPKTKDKGTKVIVKK